MAEIQIKIGSEVSGALQGLQQVQQGMAQTGKASQTLTTQLSKVPNSSNQATQSLVNLSRVAQDAPFGFIGIANNINPLLESFQRLKATTGSTGGAFKALGSSLTGAGGIGLAVGVVSSLLVVFGDRLFGVGKKAKEAKDLNEELGKSLASQAVKLTTLVGLVKNINTSDEDRVKALRAINQEYSQYLGNLDGEKVSLENISLAYDKIIDSLVRQAVVKGLQEEITKEVTKTAAALIALEKTEKRREITAPAATNKISDAIENYNKATTDGLQAQVQRGQFIDKAVAREQVYSFRVAELTESLKRQLAPLLQLTDKFDDLDIKLTKVGKNTFVDDLIKRAKLIESTLGKIFIIPQLDVDAFTSKEQVFKNAVKTLKDFADKTLVLKLKPDFEAIDKIAIPFPEVVFTPNPEQAKKLSTSFENFIFDSLRTEPLEPIPVTGIIELDLAVKKAKAFEAALESFSSSINAEFQNLAADTAAGFGDALGKAFSGEGLENVFKGFIDIIAGGLQSIGRQLIQAAVVAKLAQKALKSLFTNPALALGVGVSLIAIGSALKASLNKGIQAREKGGPVKKGQPYLVGEKGPELIIPEGNGMVLTHAQTKNFIANNEVSESISKNKSIFSNISKSVSDSFSYLTNNYTTNISNPISSLFNENNSTKNFSTSLLQTLFPGIQFRQNGGSFLSGLPLVVGERGPEIFVPNVSGRIIPNTNGIGNATGGMNVSISGRFVQSGKDLVAVITNVNQSQGRNF